MSEKTQAESIAHGFVNKGFEAVREAFIENFTRRNELGAACCIYHHGEKVADLWGGVRNKATGELWEEDTMVGVFSTAKGMAGLAMALAHSRNLLDYEELVCTYWPEFAQNGKEKITVRQLLSHQAGLFAIDTPLDKNIVADPDRLGVILAQQKPAWEPGMRQAYHAQSLGFYEGELLRRIDPRHRSLGQFFQDEIAFPLGLDFYLRLPDEIPNSRLATIQQANPMLRTFNTPLPLMLASMNKHSPTYRAVFKNPGPFLFLDQERIYSRNLENPSGNGVGTARAIAQAYGSAATGGRELGLKEKTLQALMAPAVPPAHGFYDEVMKKEMILSLGFLKPNRTYPFGNPTAFGEPGAGGSFGFADPEAGIGYAYVTNQMGLKLGGDPRELALREALQRSIN
ncbi:MAG TPA: serine hydrolase domain-containing protein [Anaerolineae bacterium]|nr:serine hydrolase domain-containing protein [Anaerolineae bacterium]